MPTVISNFDRHDTKRSHARAEPGLNASPGRGTSTIDVPRPGARRAISLVRSPFR